MHSVFLEYDVLAENEIWIGQVNEECRIVVANIGAKQQWAFLVNQQFEM